MRGEEQSNRLIDRLKEAELPVCPQIRAAQGDWLYPVEGYCVLEGPPGYMIPSIEEFRCFCTTGRYADCPWFTGARPAPAVQVPTPSAPRRAALVSLLADRWATHAEV